MSRSLIQDARDERRAQVAARQEEREIRSGLSGFIQAVEALRETREALFNVLVALEDAAERLGDDGLREMARAGRRTVDAQLRAGGPSPRASGT